MTPILRAEGAGGTLDYPMAILSAQTLLELPLEMIAMNCFADVYHQPMLDHSYAYFLYTGLFCFQSHFLIIGVGDIEI